MRRSPTNGYTDLFSFILYIKSTNRNYFYFYFLFLFVELYLVDRVCLGNFFSFSDSGGAGTRRHGPRLDPTERCGWAPCDETALYVVVTRSLIYFGQELYNSILFYYHSFIRYHINKFFSNYPFQPPLILFLFYVIFDLNLGENLSL